MDPQNGLVDPKWYPAGPTWTPYGPKIAQLCSTVPNTIVSHAQYRRGSQSLGFSYSFSLYLALILRPFGGISWPKICRVGCHVSTQRLNFGTTQGGPNEPHLRNEKRYLKEGIYPFGVAFWDAVGAMLAVCGLQFACMLTTLSEPQAGGNHRCFWRFSAGRS